MLPSPVLALLILLASASQEVSGVTSETIAIGMEGDAHSFSVDEENLGMRLVLREVNEGGGVHGRRLVDIAYPRDPSENVASLANVRRLVEEDGVFLLFNFGGPASVDIGAYAMENEVPYLFPHTALLTVDGNRHVFTSFPRYEGETAVMLRYLAEERGVKRVGVLHAPNDYGGYFVDRVAERAGELGYAVAGFEPIPLRPDDVEPQVARLRARQPDAVILALYPAQARKVVEAKAALGWSDVRLVSSGPLTDEQYLNVPGGHADGTIGFCHYPDPNESDEPGVRRYRELMAKHFPGHELNRYSLYGYVFGSLVVEGLRRAGRELTRESFLDAMESIRDWDSGGILPPVSFSATNHHAQRAGFVCELVDGRFEPVSGWLEP